MFDFGDSTKERWLRESIFEAALSVHSKDPAAAMPPAPRAPHEQLEHLYNFSNTPRTLAAGKRLQEVSGVMNPCSMSLDKNMARSWQRESSKHGAR